MELADYGEGIGNATSVIRNNAAAAGLDAPVPTCPGWTVRDLVTHQGVVHRWATAVLTGADPASARARLDASGSDGAPDLLDWLDDGVVDLLNAIVAAPSDPGPFFLHNSPVPKIGWARRQCHETSIHAIDAMSARLGTAPAAAQTWLTPEHGRDGADELLRGFLPRSKQKLRSATPYQVKITADDAPSAWLLNISSEPVQVSMIDSTDTSADPRVQVNGTAVDLYLALWNRSPGNSSVTSTGSAPDDTPGEHADWLATWGRDMQITWS